MNVLMLLYPGLTQLDLTGPYEVLARYPELSICLVWKTLDPVADGTGLRLLPNATFADCPPADILFVPGGPGQQDLMDDGETLDFLARQGESARFVTAVCTGSLVLGAAGLLSGYRATCHWMWRALLAPLGATPVDARIVVDRNRITGGGVTSGIDLAFRLAAELFGEERARKVQLGLEYDPQPPFDSGSPAKAGPERAAALMAGAASFRAQREDAVRRAAARLKN